MVQSFFTRIRLDKLHDSWLLKVVVLLIGAFGVILPALVDMFPDSSWVSLPPHLAALDAGFANLNRFDELDVNSKAIGVLRQGDEGYDNIYDLLRHFDPGILPLSEASILSSTHRTGAIIAVDVFEWGNSQGKLALIRPLLLQLENEKLKPICDLRDMAFLIRDRKVRFWSRIGSAVALVALLLQTALSSSPRSQHSYQPELLQEKQIRLTDTQLETEANCSESFARANKIYPYLLLGFIVGLLVGVLLPRNKKG
jgi:hypothetical protein